MSATAGNRDMILKKFARGLNEIGGSSGTHGRFEAGSFCTLPSGEAGVTG